MTERVVVAMSGGVDSSVAAALLLEQGYEVIGVMMRLWSEPVAPTLGGTVEVATNRCCTVESVHDARAVAERLDIPFYVINVEETFKAQVVDLFIASYAAGQTPNPCLACNRHIRFGHLLRYARSLGASYLATGHYAQIGLDSEGRYQLRRGADRAKDQSYVLSVLGQADLAQTLFPVGGYTKPEVRALAAARGLPTASRVDSQDLCFIADGDYRRFLADHAAEAVQPGPILDRAGHKLGRHRGLPFYTVGQRSGLGIAASQPLYVLELDVARNALVVGPAGELGQQRLWTGPVNWVSGETPPAAFDAEVQIRYRAQPAPARVLPLPDGTSEMVFKDPLRGVTPGQAAVIYKGTVCLGGGIIQRTEQS
jgi:tRNA-uridine 2-sulfurtransferase